MPSISIYSKLAGADADALRQVAARIHARTRDAIIETGRDLIEAKRRLPHGTFGRWVRSELGMTERTATNYMNAAAVIAELAEGKPETVSEVPATVLYRLAAAPEPARATLVRRAVGGERLTAAAVADAIREARREAERKARAEAEARVPRRTKAARLRREEERRRRCEEERARRQAGERAAQQLAALLLRHLPPNERPEARRLLAEADANYGRHRVGEALHGVLEEEAGQDAADAPA